MRSDHKRMKINLQLFAIDYSKYGDEGIEMKLRDDVTRDMLADIMVEILARVKYYKDDAAKILKTDPHNEFQACMHTAYQTIEELMDARLASLEESDVVSPQENVRYKKLA